MTVPIFSFFNIQFSDNMVDLKISTKKCKESSCLEVKKHTSKQPTVKEKQKLENI